MKGERMDATTPKEALEKTCPFMSSTILDERGRPFFTDVKCIAEQCMSWKFTSPVSGAGTCLLLSK